MTFTVVLRSYGIYSHVERTNTERLAQALHRTFGRDRYDLFDEAGRRVIFDDFAADGEHPGHDVVIVRFPK